MKLFTTIAISITAIIAFIILAIVLLVTPNPIGNYVVNHLQGSSCGGILDGQDEKLAEIPSDLKNHVFTFNERAKYQTDSFSYCTPEMKKTNLSITWSEYSDPNTKAFPKNETFTVMEAYSFRQVGIGSVDAGDSWGMYYLVKDSKGQIYKMYAPSFSTVTQSGKK